MDDDTRPQAEKLPPGFAEAVAAPEVDDALEDIAATFGEPQAERDRLSVTVDAEDGGISIWCGTTELYRSSIDHDPYAEACGVRDLVMAIAHAVKTGSGLEPGIKCERCHSPYDKDHDCRLHEPVEVEP